MPVIDTRNGPLEHVVIDGDPDLAPLVFLHGGLGCIAAWGRFPARFAAATGRRALVYSRHGNGGSGPDPLPRTPRYMHEHAQDLLPELLDALGMHRPVLVGHSDGASMALLHASVRPVEAVVGMGPHMYFEEENRIGIEAARASCKAGPLAKKLALVHDDPQGVFERWSEVWISPGFRSWSIEDDLDVTAPVLVIQGDADEYGSLGQVDAVERVVRGPFQRLVPEGCDHYPHLVCPDLVIDTTRDFLATHTANTHSEAAR
ncbi:alpha/beta hydrolase [Streptomyces sp. NBC_01005]|uniref:alpha/beta fold hydrolase n=1 Tax=unclassified Streptomyces TaxID=2593676 RepID=UPI00224E5E4A|nr:MULTISPECIES: alpha/beta hydrolase [unclassified Streptomyces]WSW03108.1 alpha/beta hydrolase [Streptomyces sp. NBC_01005]WTB60275.1 alpha/beta hydrolase [Streptomyces sp. NBC_00826]WTC92614.1 alpha/beta hydrolase [Streptomyces sp. NBC_01650]MCX4902592.1 alpha/beta hydrolase [Streptomyces sp. NBC_00892]WTB60528.1 alpha/beta hydrolase [Streptomyces sp. NBC_00826]